ncbi:MAG: phosphoenolpyruvate--protein phosphotransferase [Acholeplasmatales bacterium]|nr:MAG: phosphoenolpyruvate--protein phosphotransferase [Acholeplasmatales bacterium]
MIIRKYREVLLMLHGKPLHPGRATGKVHWYVETAPVGTAKPIPQNPDWHWERLNDAIKQAEVAWQALSDTLAHADTSVSNDILQAQIAMAKDIDVMAQAKQAIYEKGKAGDEAYTDAMLAFVAWFEKMEEGQFKQRAQDIKDVLQRVLTHYHGFNQKTPVFHENTVLMASDLHPGVLLDLMQPRCVAVVLEQGSLNSHTAIVSQQLGIPVIMQVTHLHTAFPSGSYVDVDGDTGCVCKAVARQDGATYNQKRPSIESLESGHANLPCTVAVNVMGVNDITTFKASGAPAIGLFRTEFLNDVTRGGQVAAYQPFFALGVPIIVRLFDYGADKSAPHTEQANPPSQLGLRGLRWLRDHPSVMNTQLHALYEAAGGKILNIEFPMVRTPEEYAWGVSMAKKLLKTRQARNLPRPKHVNFGPLIEVPSAAWAFERYADACDFVAIGTNDLHQYFFAVDRYDPQLSALYDVLDSSFLGLIKKVIDTANQRAIPVTICGQMAADPLSAWLLSGLGTVTLSVPPTVYKKLCAHLSRLNGSSDALDLRARLLASTESAPRQIKLDALRKVVAEHA